MSMQAFKMPGDELPKTPPKSPDKPKPDDVAHMTHKAKKLDIKEPVGLSVCVCLSVCLCLCLSVSVCLCLSVSV